MASDGLKFSLICPCLHEGLGVIYNTEDSGLLLLPA